MSNVKGDKEMKRLWNEQRRKITPKVGQLTNDANAISAIVGFTLFSIRISRLRGSLLVPADLGHPGSAASIAV